MNEQPDNKQKLEVKIGKQNHVIVPKGVVKSLEIQPGNTISAMMYKPGDTRRAHFFATVHEHNNSFVVPKKLTQAFKIGYGDGVIIEIRKVFKDTNVIS